MKVSKTKVVSVSNGKKEDLLMMPDNNATEDWKPYMDAIGKLVFDQLLADHDGVVTIKFGGVFKVEE